MFAHLYIIHVATREVCVTVHVVQWLCWTFKYSLKEIKRGQRLQYCYSCPVSWIDRYLNSQVAEYFATQHNWHIRVPCNCWGLLQITKFHKDMTAHNLLRHHVNLALVWLFCHKWKHSVPAALQVDWSYPEGQSRPVPAHLWLSVIRCSQW